MTQHEARMACRAVDCVLSIAGLNPVYRVNLKGGTEGTAYYTNDLQDAVWTAQAMRKEADTYGIGNLDTTHLPNPL